MEGVFSFLEIEFNQKNPVRNIFEIELALFFRYVPIAH